MADRRLVLIVAWLPTASLQLHAIDRALAAIDDLRCTTRGCCCGGWSTCTVLTADAGRARAAWVRAPGVAVTLCVAVAAVQAGFSLQ